MVRRWRHIRAKAFAAKLPVWRAVGAALGAFAMGVQIVLAGWLIAQAAAAAAQPDLQVICSHDAGTRGDGGAPLAPAPHGQCAVCMCLQSVKILAPPPQAPRVVVLRVRGEVLAPAAIEVVRLFRIHSPYASRAPPPSA